MTSNVVPLLRRVVVTKRRVYELADDQVGRPAIDVYGPELAAKLRLTDAVI